MKQKRSKEIQDAIDEADKKVVALLQERELQYSLPAGTLVKAQVSVPSSVNLRHSVDIPCTFRAPTHEEYEELLHRVAKREISKAIKLLESLKQKGV
jgi:hypothetical protein